MWTFNKIRRSLQNPSFNRELKHAKKLNLTPDGYKDIVKYWPLGKEGVGSILIFLFSYSIVEQEQGSR